MVKARTITIHLAKSEVASHEALLKETADCHVLTPLGAAGGLDVKLFIPKRQPSNEPNWLGLIREHFDLGGLTFLSSGAGALITLRTSNRYFGIPFGYGANLLDDSVLEQDFGLKVSLNAIDPKQLRNIDVMRPDIFALRKRQQTVLASALGQFDVNQLMDVVRSITGKVRDGAFATKATGAHSLKITARMEFADLVSKCDEALRLFGSDSYKEHFSIIDNLRPIKDERLRWELDTKLLAVINSDDCDRVRIAPPEIIQNADIEEFRYRGGVKRNSSTQEPTISEWKAVRRQNGAITLDILRHDRLAICTEEGGSDVRSWPLYKCAVYDVDHGDHQYVLSEGAWYQVDANFHARVSAYYNDRVESLGLPSAAHNEGETAYNERAARETGFLLFDRNLLPVPDSRDGFELCDLLDADSKRLIHVKPGIKGSSALSHLFRQGDWAGELLMRERVFRQGARDAIQAQDPGKVDVIPLEKPVASDYEIVFAIIDTPRRDGSFDMPFFSKVSFTHAAQRLAAYGFNVTIGYIEKALPPKPAKTSKGRKKKVLEGAAQ